MSPRWGITIIYHDGRPAWHSYNMSERNARGFFEANRAFTSSKFSVILWVRENGRRVPVDHIAHRANLLRIAE